MYLCFILHTTPLSVGDIRYNEALWRVCLEIRVIKLSRFAKDISFHFTLGHSTNPGCFPALLTKLRYMLDSSKIINP